MSGRIFLGVILIITGMLWTFSNLQFININSQWFLPALGLVFLLAYFYKGSMKQKESIGFLIAGCIILMIGLFSLINKNLPLGLLESALFFFFIGMAFLLVYFIHTRSPGQHYSDHLRWSLYTGLIIIGFGIFVLFTSTANTPLMRKIYPLLAPLGLIIFGLYIIIKQKRKKD